MRQHGRSNTRADAARVPRSNIANTVMTQDVNLMSGLQYAVDVLEVRSIREVGRVHFVRGEGRDLSG